MFERKTLAVIMVLLATLLRRARAFGPRVAARAAGAQPRLLHHTVVVYQSSTGEDVTEKTEEEKAAIKAAREARK